MEVRSEKAQILYTLNGGERSEEWYVGQALVSGNKVTAKLPKESTHYFFNLVDEKNFWSLSLFRWTCYPLAKLDPRDCTPKMH